MWKIVLSEFMAKQITTMPPEEGFTTYTEAYKWALKFYGSTAIDSYVAGKDVGCHIVKE